MKQWIGLLTIALFGGLASAAVVDAEKAAAVALAFAEQNAILAEHTEGVGEATSWENVWVVPLKPSGYVVVEKDDIRPPVIAFGKEDFPKTPAPPMADLLERPAIEEGLTTLSTLSATSAHEEWAELLEPSVGLVTQAASPMPPSEATVMKVGEIKDFTYAWSQSLPYNLYAPGLSYERTRGGLYGDTLYDYSLDKYGMRSACGCTTTAISQVAAWFQWPYVLREAMSIDIADAGDVGFATLQIAAPGKPYNWEVLANATNPEFTDADGVYGEEVGRFIQHWATLLKVRYIPSGSSSAMPTELRPQLSLFAGYKVISPECVSAYAPEYVEGEESRWAVTLKKELPNWEAVYASFAKMIYEYQIPVPTGIPVHYIVCCGWAEDVDAVLSAETSYAKLNYGWGPSGGMNGWFAIRTVTGEGDGEAVPKDNKVFLLENFAILPLQCGEIVTLAAQDKLSEKLSWYESPYWTKRYPNPDVKTRSLQVVTFDTTATTDVALSLEAAAKSDANWTYTPATTDPKMPERLALDHTRTLLSSGVIFPELVKAASTTLKVEVALERLVATYKMAKANTPEADLELITDYIPETAARELFVALEDTATRACVLSQKVTLGEDMSVTSGSATAEFTVEAGKVYRVLLTTGMEGEAWNQISLDTLAYTVTGVTVKECYEGAKASYPFKAIDFPTKEDGPGTLTVGTLSSATVTALNENNANKKMWLAVTIATPTEPNTTDALWTPVTIAERVEPPKVAFTSNRFFLNDVKDPISFTLEGTNIQSVTAYLSQTLWLNEESRAGFEVLTLTEEERKNVKGSFTFTLDGRANTDEDTQDALTLNSPETVGRDAVLSLCVIDAVGNMTWTHTRVTWGLSDGMIALITEQKRELVTAYLTRLLFAAIYAGCYDKKEGTDKVVPKSDSEEKKATMQAAMAVVEDMMRLGYVAPVESGQTALASQPLLDEVLLGAKTFNPRVEVLSVSPDAITFKLVGDEATSTEATPATSSATLAKYVGSAITVEGGATLDAPLTDITKEIHLELNDDGTYTLKVPTGKNFFQFKL